MAKKKKEIMVQEKLIALISALIVTISMIYVNVNLYGGISIVSLFSEKKKNLYGGFSL